MKTTIEVSGYKIEIEEVDGLVTVKAEKDDEIVEEFSLETSEESGEEGSDDVQSFDDFGSDEEEDFEEGEEEVEAGEEDIEAGEEEVEEGEEEMEEAEDEEKAPKLESFQSFINKKK
jgi:hypothetical protein